MSEATNFADKASVAMRRWQDLVQLSHPVLSRCCAFAAEALNSGVRFVLPDDGMVIPGKTVDATKLMFGGRLPFPVTLVEFKMSGRLPVFENAPIQTMRRLAIAVDLRDEDAYRRAIAIFPGLKECADTYARDAAFIWAIDSMDDSAPKPTGFNDLGRGGGWMPGWLGFVAPYDQAGEAERGDFNRRLIDSGSTRKDGEQTQQLNALFSGLPIAETGVQMLHERRAGGNQPPELFCGEYVAEISGVLGVIAALQCKNVRTRVVEPDAKLQAARSRKGKAPLRSYTELVLRQDVERSVSLGESGAKGLRSRPSEHVRSGHIRRVNGESIWVNWAMVNVGVRPGQATRSRRIA